METYHHKIITNTSPSITLSKEKEEYTCFICFCILRKPISLPCSHSFCKICITKVYLYDNVCAYCQEPINYPLPKVDQLLKARVYKYLTERREKQEYEQNNCLLLKNLPDELLVLILKFLKAKDLCKISLVCKTFKRVSEDPALWKDLCFEKGFTISNDYQEKESSSLSPLSSLIDSSTSNHSQKQSIEKENDCSVNWKKLFKYWTINGDSNIWLEKREGNYIEMQRYLHHDNDEENNEEIQRQQKEQEIRFASLNQIIIQLTSYENSYLKPIMLSTYRSYVTPQFFLEKLFQRYNVPEYIDKETKKKVQTNTFNIILEWVKIELNGFILNQLSNCVQSYMSYNNNVKSNMTSRCCGGSSSFGGSSGIGSGSVCSCCVAIPSTSQTTTTTTTNSSSLVPSSFYESHDRIIELLEKFIQKLLKEGNHIFAEKLKTDLVNHQSLIENALLSKSKNYLHSHHNNPIPPPIIKPSKKSNKLKGDIFSIFDWDEEEIARQLTIYDHTCFSKILPIELLNNGWLKKDLKYRSQNILNIVKRFSILSSWVSRIILESENLKERAIVFSKIINIMKHLKEMNNFQSIFCIFSGISKSEICRLKNTKALLKKNSLKELEKIQSIVDNRRSYYNCRNIINSLSSPCVPYCGIYLTDLVFIEDGNIKYYNNNNILINVQKLKLVSNVITNIKKYQSTSILTTSTNSSSSNSNYYNFIEVNEIQNYFNNIEEYDSNILYELSLKREPRNRT